MQIVINVPEKEFSTEIEDRFQDFFKRLEIETKEHMIYGTNLLCGAYELETIDMFLKAFKNATPLPKGHGAIKDVSQIEIPMCEDRAYERWVQVAINSAPTIIEADKEE